MEQDLLRTDGIIEGSCDRFRVRADVESVVVPAVSAAKVSNDRSAERRSRNKVLILGGQLVGPFVGNFDERDEEIVVHDEQLDVR